MYRKHFAISLVLLSILAAGIFPAYPPMAAAQAVSWPSIQTTLVASGFNNPVFVTNAGDNSDRLFVVELAGRIKIVKNGQVTGTFLDISGRVRSISNGGGSLQGLFSVAFPPDYANKGYFYVDYTDIDGNTQISRFYLGNNADTADPSSEQGILTIFPPTGDSNYSGDLIAFGPDGYLYIGAGSGMNEPSDGQNTGFLKGKLLRIAVEPNTPPTPTPSPSPSPTANLTPMATATLTPTPTEIPTLTPAPPVGGPGSFDYTIYLPAIYNSYSPGSTGLRLPVTGLALLGSFRPVSYNPALNSAATLPSGYDFPPDNPFMGVSGYREEIWALGLRNPWRFSFDRQTGDLYIGDAGQFNWEEVDFQLAGSKGGENYGWDIMEGQSCYNPSTNCDMTGLTMPVFVRATDANGGCVIIGGYVYRGQSYPSMQGIYFSGDYCNGHIWGLQQSGGSWQSQDLLDTPYTITSFGEDQAGELYVTDANGGVYQITAK